MKRMMVGSMIVLVCAALFSAVPLSLWSLQPAHAEENSADATCGTVRDLPAKECAALVALYRSTDGANWLDNANWLATSTACEWTGVICNDDHVVELYLPNNGLRGSLPAELTDLTAVEFLDFSANDLHGKLPAGLTALHQLEEIYLADTGLEGVVDDSFGSLENLTLLDVTNTTICMEPMVHASAWLENLDHDESDVAIHFCGDDLQLDQQIFLPIVTGQ
ncbi:MAG TPA: hypothetical protein P5121_35830 [Caldilineaceae bacterium]|mgnify:CR=1 FL=1|nr:hypothetical protein [Caldilineaceae bacterium]